MSPASEALLRRPIAAATALDRPVEAPAPERVPAPEHPVFVTRTGRPRRRPGVLAALVAAVMSAWIACVVVGGSGFASVPALNSAALAVHHRHAHLTGLVALRGRREHARVRVARAPVPHARPDAT